MVFRYRYGCETSLWRAHLRCRYPTGCRRRRRGPSVAEGIRASANPGGTSTPRASKNELHERLWPATFVSEANLASLVAEIRDSLGDDARHPRFVRTAHRFGYAFCGEVAVVPESARPSEASSFCWLLKDGRRLPLRIGENILGRDDDVIQIDSPTVSRRHARIVITAADALLEDLGSKNGTFTQGAPVSTPVRLADGDELRIGSVVLRFRMILPKGATATWSGDEQA